METKLFFPRSRGFPDTAPPVPSTTTTGSSAVTRYTPLPLVVYASISTTLTVKTERAARREVSSAEEAMVTTAARLATAGAAAEARSDWVLPTKVLLTHTAEAAEVMAAIAT
jgi:hypothetical protein